MKLIRIKSKEKVEIGDTLIYGGNPDSPYNSGDKWIYHSITPRGTFIACKRNEQIITFHPSLFGCELVDD